MHIHDCRKSGWGHVLQRWSQDDPDRVCGCLTPLPQVGDHVVVEDGRIYRFVEVDPMIDPADGFLGRLEAVDTLVAENAPVRPMSKPKPPSNFSDHTP